MCVHNACCAHTRAQAIGGHKHENPLANSSCYSNVTEHVIIDEQAHNGTSVDIDNDEHLNLWRMTLTIFTVYICYMLEYTSRWAFGNVRPRA
jgi:hypothetical protein